MNNLFKNTQYKILELFMEMQDHNFHAREIARVLKMSHVTVLNHIKDLVSLDLIRINKDTLYPTYYANKESEEFKRYKKDRIVSNILNSGLVNHIQESTLPSCIILYGSCAKGTYDAKSDIDIYIEAKETKINLSRYEKRLKKTINLLFEPTIRKLSGNLMNNIINGTILYGFMKIR